MEMPRKRADDSLDLLNREQVAKLFRVSTKTVTRRMQAGLLPRPIRGAHLWTRQSLKKFIIADEEVQAKIAALKTTETKKKKPKTRGTTSPRGVTRILCRPCPATALKAARNGRRKT